MKVVKRTGQTEDVSFDKVIRRIKLLSKDLSVEIYDIAQKVVSRIYDGVKTSELDELAAQICSSMIVEHPDYGTLASRIIISNHHKNTSPSFSETVTVLYNNTDLDGKPNPLVSEDLFNIVLKNKEKLNSYVNYHRDYSFDYFGFKTLEKAYLLRVKGSVVERPQHMFMRVALGIHGFDIKDAIQTYDLMSTKHFVHATPTLFNAGTPRPQCSSCYLIGMEDSIDGIFDTMKECALISKYAGGIGLWAHDIRARNSRIRGTNGTSTGIAPMLKVFNNIARYVNQAGKRNGSIAVYLEPWHADVEQFLEMKLPQGTEEDRARDLFYALWIPDLFMQRVKDGKQWSLMCPDQCPGLSDVWGDKFVELYESYEKQGKFIKQVNAQDIWFKVLQSQIESGVPYLCYKDAANRKSNQQNLGTIKSSNLCVAPETMVLTDKGYYPIKDLRDQHVKVWNGKVMSDTIVKQTGRQQKLITVKFDNGMSLRCTPYHKFYIEMDLQLQVKEAGQLEPGMKLVHYDLPTLNVDYGKTLENAYEQGWSSAKGTSSIVPLNYTLASKIKWLEGYVDGNGIINHNCIQVSNANKEFCTTVFFMLQTLGIKTSIIEDLESSSFIMTIHNNYVHDLTTLGFKPKMLDISALDANQITKKSIHVVGIEDNGYYDDTYCFNEPLEHKGMFNGVLTGQCSEIIEFSDKKESSVCNLASVCLPTYVGMTEEALPYFDFERLHEVTKVITKNLNKVIDINFYPVEKTRRSNLRHRPIGIGVQGLADTFIKMRMAYDSTEARQLNRQIFETIYHAALEQSMEISRKRHDILTYLPDDANEYDLHLNEFEKEVINTKFPGAYSTFEGSPASKGLLQFDLWNVVPSERYDWNKLKKDIQTYGIRNSLLLAPMPTASTSQIMGFNEAFEAITSNLYKRKTLAGEFILVNKYLVKDLVELGLWSKEMKDIIIINDGSIQSIDKIPQHIKDIYKIVWEIKQKVLIDMAADRGAFICQSQSLNLFIEDPTFQKLSSMHFYSWQQGLKTGIYYLRTRPKASAQKFTIDPTLMRQVKNKNVETNEECTMCSA